MAVAATRHHDEQVHICSLAQAIAAATKRQRARVLSSSPPSPPPPFSPSVHPADAETPPRTFERLQATAVRQQREATASRMRARQMRIDDHTMRLRIAELAAHAGIRRDRREGG
jgi:hypothetical protein